MVATRRVLSPPKKGSAIVRPRSRTLTAVHDAMLEYVVYPAEIIGKRIKYHSDGSKIMKVYLDSKERNNTENKLETFAGVYRKLSGKDVVFEYPSSDSVKFGRSRLLARAHLLMANGQLIAQVQHAKFAAYALLMRQLSRTVVMIVVASNQNLARN
ncbi:hypothetical protein IFM89_019943 [Coptis chinensis]|uniref:40S ribosomal protein S7 n=1 Tax=Coptis chinensis TaxID=261450 RepID=A0A835HBZ0_9MAGN|nr:hypothetical protein IFM89_019943 [Coptis chinensis]